MKVGGTPITAPAKELLVIPRESGDLVFWAQAVPNYDEFNEKCREPEPPIITHAKDGRVPDYEDSGYQQQLENYNRKRIGYLVIKTLEPSEIEWDTVSLENPATWGNWESDFEKAGLTQVELNLLLTFVNSANNLSRAKLDAAKSAFLRGRQKA